MPRLARGKGSQGPETDVYAAKIFHNFLLCKGYRIVMCEKELYVYDPETGVYVVSSKNDGAFLCGLAALKCGEPLGDYATQAANMSPMLKMLKIFVHKDDDFVKNALKTTRGKQLFRNCIWDARNKAAIPFSPDYVFFDAVPHDFDRAWVEADELSHDGQQALGFMESVFGVGAPAEYFLQVSARTLAHEFQDKRRLLICPGDTNSGKGSLTAYFDATFPSLTDTTDAGCLMKGSQRGTGLRDKEFIVPLQHSLFVFTHELPCDGDMNGESLKQIISGGDKCTARPSYGKQQHFTMKCQVMICCNKLPTVTPADEALAGRLSVIRTPHRYVSKNDYDALVELTGGEAPAGVRVGDPNIKEKLQSKEMQLGLVELLVKNYTREEPDRPDSVLSDTFDMIEISQAKAAAAAKAAADLSAYVEYTGNLTDFVVFSEVWNQLGGAENVSHKKLPELLRGMGPNVAHNARTRVAGYVHTQSVYSGLKMRDEDTASNKRPLPDAAATAAAGPMDFYFGGQPKREYAPADSCDES